MALVQGTETKIGKGEYKYIAANKGYNGLKVRSGPSTSYEELGRFPHYYESSDIIYVDVLEVSNGWIHHEGASDYDVPAGWSAIASGGITYFNKITDPSSYEVTVYNGYADADYYWPNAGSTSYSYQTYERRWSPGFNLYSSPGDNTAENTKTDIVLTIDYDNGNSEDTQTGQTWTESTYSFVGWNLKSSTPGSLIIGTSEFGEGEYRWSLDDEKFYAVYSISSTSDPKYSNNTKSLGTPTKTTFTEDYIVQFDGNGGTTPIESTTVTKTITYKFSKWTGTSGITISGTSCTFTQTGTVTANYTETPTPAKVSSMPTPTRPGYKFLGWGTSTSQTSNLIAAGAESPEITTKTTYYAIWKIDGSVRLYINDTDKYKIAMIWMYLPTNDSDTKPWKLVIPYIKTSSDWKITAG